MDRARWEVRVACILQDGLWAMPRQILGPAMAPTDIDKLFDLLEMPDLAPRGYLNLASVGEAVARLTGPERPDLIFPVTHGAFGEDGRLQGLLDFIGVPYAGSGVLGSALAMDKVRACELVEAHGIRTPRRLVAGQGHAPWNAEQTARLVEDHLGWPVFVKPACGGSSVGAAPAACASELDECVRQAASFGGAVLIEERIEGMEVTCGVIELAGCGACDEPGSACECGAELSEGSLCASGDAAGLSGAPGRAVLHRVACPPTAIRPRGAEFFDYESKYRPGASEEITPAPLDREVLRRIQEIAERAHVLLGCRGLSRTDMIVTPEGEPVYLETNTLPGMTPTSLLPQGARAIGLDMTQLLSLMIETALASAPSRASAVEVIS